MRRFRCAAAVAGLLLAVTASGGCSFEESSCEGEGCDQSVETVVRPAFAAGPTVRPWTLVNGQMPLCFAQDPSLTVPDYDTIRNRVLATLNSAWGNVPGLDFVTGCTEPTMNILLNNQSGVGVCQLGDGASCTIGGVVTDLPALDGVAIHEVGHGLGLNHEHQRPDAGPLCDGEQNIKNACQACTAATCTVAQAKACWFFVPAASSITVTAVDAVTAASRFAGGNAACQSCATGTCPVGSCDAMGTCTPADSYFGCFLSNPMDGTVILAAGDQAFAQFRVDDRTEITNGVYLTKYDPRSIMNYCSGPNGRTEPVPTAYDMLGMEMLYSIDRNYGLGCGVGCFLTTSGLVTSTTGSLVSEWIARGSLNVAFRVSGTAVDVL
jgi:hypothetical protein